MDDNIAASQLQWKTNAITLFRDNKDFKQLCKKVGGKYIHINKLVGQK